MEKDERQRFGFSFCLDADFLEYQHQPVLLMNAKVLALAKPCIPVVAVLFSACATPSAIGPLSIPLEYKTMAEPGDFSALPSCVAIADVQVVDARADKAIGKRFVNDNAATVAPVTAATDVATWVRAGALEVFKQSGVVVGRGRGPVLRLSVEQLRTNENVVHRSGYDARIVMTGKLSKGGKTCWDDRASGAAENYGYSGSIENYQETLNHALDRSLIALIGGQKFRNAACDCSGR